MPIEPTTIKRLFAKSRNQCAMPRCMAVLIQYETVIGEICHIRARSKGGPRYDPALSLKERNAFANLILLCPTCHSLVDKGSSRFSVETLTHIKASHEGNEPAELTAAMSVQALKFLPKSPYARTTNAKASRGGVAVAIGGDNYAPINVSPLPHPSSPKTKYPKNSIGADANLTNYIEYLCTLYSDYTALIYPQERDRWIRLSTSIKRKFRLKKRTRLHLSVERFDDLVDFLIREKLAKTPVGQKHIKNGTRICRTFEDYRHGKM
jgi:hypothetical protein